jgi:hypothetical protein
VPRVRLRIHDVEIPGFPCQYDELGRTGIETVTVPKLRLAMTALLGPDPPPEAPANPTAIRLVEDALIDTGAWLSVIRRTLWEQLDGLGLIEHLQQSQSSGPLPIGGVRSDYTLGRVWIGLLDEDNPPRQMPAVPVIAMLLQNEKVKLPFPILFGLHRGVLDGRRLWREPRMGFDPTPASGLPYSRTDAGPRYGQDWWLEDAA